MQKRLTHIAPVKLGIVLAVVYGVMSLIIIVPFFLLHSLASVANTAKTGSQGLPAIFTGGFLIFLPVIYAVIGFIGGAIAALIYNLVAKWTGGIEFTTEEAS
ncbi:MAG: hypothetical protein ABR955_00795 [Verrucomicrobiota bacterium]|jgi:hypothetical protein